MRTVLAALSILGLIGPAAAVNDPVGIWTLSVPGTKRLCSVQIRTEAAATGQMIAMPPGCRRAFPVLAAVRSWSIPDGVHLGLNDANGVNILMFGEMGDGRLQASADQDGPYVLTAVGKRRDAVPPAAAVATPPATAALGAEAAVQAPVAAAPPPRPAPTIATVSGHYAVMRGPRDTGCMVTLDDPGRTSSQNARARLAPACRDQGIIVFDPVGWSLRGNRLVLEARKGHTAVFAPDESNVWVRDGKSGPPLGLKHL